MTLRELESLLREIVRRGDKEGTWDDLEIGPSDARDLLAVLKRLRERCARAEFKANNPGMAATLTDAALEKVRKTKVPRRKA